MREAKQNNPDCMGTPFQYSPVWPGWRRFTAPLKTMFLRIGAVNPHGLRISLPFSTAQQQRLPVTKIIVSLCGLFKNTPSVRRKTLTGRRMITLLLEVRDDEFCAETPN
jgi:hypothetical protein